MPLYIFYSILQCSGTKFGNDGTQVWGPRLRFLVLAVESSGHVLWVKFLNYTKLSFSCSFQNRNNFLKVLRVSMAKNTLANAKDVEYSLKSELV